MIVLTSFKESKRILKIVPDIDVFSVSRWQPLKYHYDELDFLGAFDIEGNRLRLKNSSISEYKHKLFEYYISRRQEVNEWLLSLDNDKHIMLCCWCPDSTATKKQIKKYGSFVCHTGLIGKLINKFRPDIEILLDNDRHKWLIEEYKPEKYKVI